MVATMTGAAPCSLGDALVSAAFVEKQDVTIRPDPTRVVLLAFKPATEPRHLSPTDRSRANHIVDRVMALEPAAAEALLADVLATFDRRHHDLIAKLDARAEDMEYAFAAHAEFSAVQRQLVGAYFLHEYSFEATALFNPSIVLHPDQTGAPPDGCRFILSLRAVGEGHLSSIGFRQGSIDATGQVAMDARVPQAGLPTVMSRSTDRDGQETVDVEFDAALDLSERVLFPLTPAQSNGLEDARFLTLQDETAFPARPTYCATYTAYCGTGIRSEMLTTNDFRRFTLSPMSGPAARNKGLALFPRRIGGRYAMIGRLDNESLYLLHSDNLLDWNDGVFVFGPSQPWEFVQIGTCGAPIELDEGWLLLTHGVGALRRYAIGAVLLDKADPSQVLGRSSKPFLCPEPAERDGYVPNVVYTCGGMRHRGRIILPYAVSDSFTRFASIDIRRLLESLSH